MNSITYNTAIPADGNPNGIVDGPLGALFYKNGPFYKVNYTGSSGGNWQEVYFVPTNTPSYYITAADAQLLASINTGSYLYTKTTIQGTPYGWSFLGNLALAAQS